MQTFCSAAVTRPHSHMDERMWRLLGFNRSTAKELRCVIATCPHLKCPIFFYWHIDIWFVEPPFGLRLFLPFWCRRGGVLVHGWCAEKENRGKRGSGKGKIGAGVGSCRSMDPVGISSGSRRAPIFAFLGTAFGQSGSSRDPVGIQPGSSRAPMSGGS